MAILSRLLNLNRLGRAILPLAVVLMEALWVYPWLMLMARWPIFAERRMSFSPVSLLFLLGSSFLVTRFSLGRNWSMKRRRLSVIAGGLIAIVVVLRIEYPLDLGLSDLGWFVKIGQLMVASFIRPHPVVISLIAGLFIWWLGIGLGHSPFHFENVYRYFSVGLLTQVVLIIAWGAGSPGDLMSTTGVYVAGFFACGLSALALARLQSMPAEGQEGKISAVFNGRWFAVIIAVTGVIILVGIGVASIFSPPFLSVLGQLFNLVSGALFWVLAIFVTIVAFVLAVSIYIVQTIINMLQGEIPTDVSTGNVTSIPELQQSVSRTLSSESLIVLKWGLFLLVLAVVLFFLARAIVRYRSARAEGDVEEINESLWSWGGFMADVGLFFSWLWQRFRGKVKAIVPVAPVLGRRRRSETNGRLNIREIYQRLLRQAAQLGLARRDYETPYEYGRRLGHAIPEGDRLLNELTDLYMNVRYGELAAEPRQVDQANGLWAVIKPLLDRLEADRRE